MKKKLFLLYVSVVFAGIPVFSQSAKTVNRARGQLPSGNGGKNYSSKENMVLIKGGSFVMGSPVSENWREKDEVQHTVTLDDFYISKYEVTQAEYESLMKKNPSGAESGATKVCRGGGWNDFGKHLRCAFRSSELPEEASANRGFRVARNAGRRVK